MAPSQLKAPDKGVDEIPFSRLGQGFFRLAFEAEGRIFFGMAHGDCTIPFPVFPDGTISSTSAKDKVHPLDLVVVLGRKEMRSIGIVQAQFEHVVP